MADGYRSQCKACDQAGRTKEQWTQWNRNKGHIPLEEWKARPIAGKEGRRQYMKSYRESRLPYYAERQRWRYASKVQATPPWLTDDQKWMMEEIYELRDIRSEATGVNHHVDHIVPLLGDTARGLHVPWNLRVITADQNRRKSNTVNYV